MRLRRHRRYQYERRFDKKEEKDRQQPVKFNFRGSRPRRRQSSVIIKVAIVAIICYLIYYFAQVGQ